MTEPERRGSRGTLAQVLKVAAVVVVVAVVVWWIPLGTDETPTTQPAAERVTPTTRPEPPAQRFSPGEIEDRVPLPEGAYAAAGSWDGDLFWLITDDSPQAASGGAGAVVMSIDPATAEVLSETALDTPVSAILADPDAIWVTEAGSGDLTLIDPATGEVATTVSLPDGGVVHDAAVTAGDLWVTADDGRVFRIAATTSEPQEVAALTPEDAGRIVTELGDLWVLPRSDGDTATRFDPVGLSSVAVPLGSVGHETTTAGFVDTEFFVAGDGPDGAVVSWLDPTTLEVAEAFPMAGTLAHLGWVAGSFGALDDEGVLLRIVPAGPEEERLTTSWDGAHPVFTLDRELWMLTDDGATVERVLITGVAN